MLGVSRTLGACLVSAIHRFFYLARREFAEQKPQLLQIVLDGFREVSSWTGSHREDSARVLSESSGIAYEALLKSERRHRYGLEPITPEILENYREFILPGALPSILVGLRFALGLSWLVLIVAESIGAERGLGYVAMTAREFMQMDMLVLTIVLWALLGKLADLLARRVERWLLPWQPVSQRITHDVEEALLLADRVFVIADGRVVEGATIALPRPRERTDPVLVHKRAQLLAAIMGDAANAAHASSVRERAR